MKFDQCSSIILRKFKYLEPCIVEIPIQNNKSIIIISAYYPSSNNDNNSKTELFQLFQFLKLESLDKYFILAGDLNAKHQDWGNTIANQKGFKIKEWMSDHEISFKCKIVAITIPSYPRTKSFLDL